MTKKHAPNDRITAHVAQRGYCCPLSFFCQNNGKKDSNTRLAQKAGLGLSTIEFNKRKMRNGGVTCGGKGNCQFETFEDKYIEMRKNGEIGSLIQGDEDE